MVVMRYLRGLIYFWLIVSAPLLGMTGFAQGAFLCWGDGGVGIETEACESGCSYRSSESDHEEHSDHGLCEYEDSCGTCIDIPLPSGGTIKRVLRPDSESELRVVAVCATHQTESIVVGGQASGAGLVCIPPGGVDGVLASLRTVVLLN
jgi:hypothetical protein